MEAGDHVKSGRIVVRQATEDDAEILSRFAAQTFQETFGRDSKPSDMDAYLRKAFSPALQRAEITNNAATIILASDCEGTDGGLIGYVHLIADHRNEALVYRDHDGRAEVSHNCSLTRRWRRVVIARDSGSGLRLGAEPQSNLRSARRWDFAFQGRKHFSLARTFRPIT